MHVLEVRADPIQQQLSAPAEQEGSFYGRE
jgi:hypothetical protein